MRRMSGALYRFWDKLKTRLSDDAGTVGNEYAWVTALGLAGAAVIVGILIAWGVDAANSIPTPGPAGPPPQP